MKLSFVDRDKQLCADAANAVAEAYEQFNTDTRFTTSSQAREFLTKQVARLQSEIATEERKLQDYGTKKEILALSNGTQDISEKALGDMNAKYVEAQGRLALARARFEATAKGSADSLPEVLTSPLIAELKKQYAEIERNHSQMAERFKADWPPLQQLQEELDRAKDAPEHRNRSDRAAGPLGGEGRLREDSRRGRAPRPSGRIPKGRGPAGRSRRHRVRQPQGRDRDQAQDPDRPPDAPERHRDHPRAQGHAGQQHAHRRSRRGARAARSSRTSRSTSCSRSSSAPGLGAGAALLLNYLDNTVKNEMDIQRYAAVPALGFIPLYQPLARRRRERARVRRASTARTSPATPTTTRRSRKRSRAFARRS